MKRILLPIFSFFLAMLFCLPNINAQEENRCISTLTWHEQKLKDDPNYAKHVEQHRNFVDEFITQEKNPTCANGPLIIPVAFHFDSGNTMPSTAAEQACAISLAQDMIVQFNEHFAGLETGATTFNSNFGSCFNTTVGVSCMEFCLASQNHPAGFGLNNGDPAVTFGTANFNYPTTLGLPGGTPVNPAWAGYVNIYITDLGSSGVLGISNGIPGNFNGDGVMINACQFGTSSVSCSGFNNTSTCGTSGGINTSDGRTVTHEIGHYFGLFHIWGDEFFCSLFPNDTGQCSGSDQIGDTPNMSCSYSQYNGCASHSTCADLPSTCGSPDMYMNFMAYSADPCMYMFTSGQADVMYATAVGEGYTTAVPPSCDPNASSCPPDYANGNALSGNENGAGNPDYETDGPLESTQNITGGMVDYDSKIYVLLNPGFQITAGAVLCAFIDGCNNGNGGVNLKEDKEETEKK